MDHDPLSWYLANRLLLFGFLRMMGPADMAEDVLQETYVALQRSAARFTPGADPGAWVRGIARNLARQALARRQRLQALPAEALLERLEQVAAAAVEDDGDDEAVDQLQRCLGVLAPAQRELVHARYHQGLSLAQLSARTGRSAGAIQVALSRLRATLLACIEQARRRAP